MWFKPGTKILVTLTDGSTLVGTARMVWWPSKLRLVDAGEIHAPGTIAELAGLVTVPTSAISYVQTGI